MGHCTHASYWNDLAQICRDATMEPGTDVSLSNRDDTGVIPSGWIRMYCYLHIQELVIYREF